MRFLTKMVQRTEFLLWCGVVGPLLFITVFLVEGATRPDYDPFRSMVSELSLSEYGWQQIGNFMVSGALIVAFAVGLRRVRIMGPSATWGPRILTITGLGLISAGVFVCDPGLAYPAGAPAGLPMGTGTWHNILHAIAGAVVFFSLPIACCVLARVSTRGASGRGWTIYSLATAVLGFVFFMASNVSAMHGGPAGLFQRLSICMYLFWLVTLALRLSREVAGNSADGNQRTPRSDSGRSLRGSTLARNNVI